MTMRNCRSEIYVRIISGHTEPELSVDVRLLASGQDFRVPISDGAFFRMLTAHTGHTAFLSGLGEWETASNDFGAPVRLLRFDLTGCRILETAPQTEIFKRLVQAARGGWDYIDVIKLDDE